MNILVTGAKGMVGQALCANLKNIRDGKNRTRPNIKIEEIYEYDIDNAPEELDEYCQKADFVFNLAGINRPKTNDEFMQGNFGFGEKLLNTLKKYDNTAPVMLSSSIQATLSLPRRRPSSCSNSSRRRGQASRTSCHCPPVPCLSSQVVSILPSSAMSASQRSVRARKISCTSAARVA